MNKALLTAALLAMASVAAAQNVPNAGLIRAQATFAVGKDTWLEGAKPYLYTELEVMPDDHVGIAGSTFIQLSNLSTVNSNATVNTEFGYVTHHLFFGPMWHFRPDQPFDVHVGLQPGFTAINQTFGNAFALGTWEVAPSVAGTAGVAYYGSFFHVFAQAKVLSGYHAGADHRGSLTEGMLTAGLGWNIDVKK